MASTVGLSDSDSDGFQTPPEEFAEVSNGVEQGAELGTKLEEIVTNSSNKGTDEDLLGNGELQDMKVKPATSKEKETNELESIEEAITDHDNPITTVDQYKLFPLSNTRQDVSNEDHGIDLSRDRYTATSLYQGYVTMIQCQQLTNAERKYHTILGHTGLPKEQLCKEGKENEENNTTRQDDLLTGENTSLETNEVGGACLIDNEDPVGGACLIDNKDPMGGACLIDNKDPMGGACLIDNEDPVGVVNNIDDEDPVGVVNNTDDEDPVGGACLIDNEDPVGVVNNIDDEMTLEVDSYLARSLCDNYRQLMQVKASEQAHYHGTCVDMIGGKESLETSIVEDCAVVGVANDLMGVTSSEVGVATSGDQIDGMNEELQDSPLSGDAPPTIVDHTLINELSSVTPTLEKNMPTMNNDTPTLNDETSTLNNDTPTLNDETSTLNNDTPTLNDETSTLNNDTPTLNDETSTLNNDTANLNNDMPTLNDDTSTLNNDASIPFHEQHLSVDAHVEAMPTLKDLEVGGTFKDLGTNTEATPTSDLGTNTEATPTLADVAINTNTTTSMDTSTNTNIITTTDSETLATVECSDCSCNTDLSVFELLKHVHRNEKYLRMEEELKLKLIEYNEEKSKRMVNDNLVAILQSDIVSLQQRNAEESTNRIRMDGEIAELKGELEHCRKQVKEKEQRVTELDESLTGTLLLVRKLEEQSSVMTNKGGLDYLLQAKISDGRAHEAEQKLQVLQADLLQSQAEVQRLLDRLGEFSRERREMVSGGVHTQLLQISDERAEMAERKVKELEQEIMHLRSNRPRPPHIGDQGMFGSYPSSTSSLYGLRPLPSYRSPYSSSYDSQNYYTNDKPLDQYDSDSSNIDSLYSGRSQVGMAPPSAHMGGPKDTPIGVQVLPAPSKPLPPSQHVPTSTGLPMYDLPSVVPSVTMVAVAPPTLPQHQDPSSDGDSSSDWSSSDEEDPPHQDHTLPTDTALRPSSHMSLQSKWEWLSQDNNPTTPPKKQTRPPPIAPKPKLLTRSLSSSITNESPVTFEEPPVKPSLPSHRRPSGPKGRRLPSRNTSLTDFS